MTLNPSNPNPYADTGLALLWARGRKDGFRRTSFPPPTPKRNAGYKAYAAGYAVGTAERNNRPA